MSDKVEIGKVLIGYNRAFGPSSWLDKSGPFSTEPVFQPGKREVPYIVFSDVLTRSFYKKIIMVFVPAVGKLMFLYEHEVLEDLKTMESNDE